MDDDLNTPDALAALFDLVQGHQHPVRRSPARPRWRPRAAAFDELTGVLGLLYNRKKDEIPAEVILALVDERAAAKKAKDWARADAIRAQLTEMGWAVKDTAQGPAAEQAVTRRTKCRASLRFCQKLVALGGAGHALLFYGKERTGAKDVVILLILSKNVYRLCRVMV